MSVDQVAIGQRIRKVRGADTLEEFGKRLGVRGASIYRYEAGQVPNVDMLMMIAEVGKVDIRWLLTGKEGAKESKVVEEEEMSAEVLERVLKVRELLAGADERTVMEFDEFMGMLERVKGAERRRA